MMIDTEKLENLNSIDFAHVDAMVRSETKARARLAAIQKIAPASLQQYQAAMQNQMPDQNGVVINKG